MGQQIFPFLFQSCHLNTDLHGLCLPILFQLFDKAFFIFFFTICLVNCLQHLTVHYILEFHGTLAALGKLAVTVVIILLQAG